MRNAVYNSGIPDKILNTADRAFVSPSTFCVIAVYVALLFAFDVTAQAIDWNVPEQQLARKIVAVTGPGAVAITIENRSSLGKRDSEIIQNGLHDALGMAGLRFVKAEESAATLSISLSENQASYVWVAVIRQGTDESTVVMVSVPRPEGSIPMRDSAPLSLRKSSLWAQDDPILDLAVLEESTTPTHIAVLDSESISLYRQQAGSWRQEQRLAINHQRPWPRDVRGRLVESRDHFLDAYLPGVICSTSSTLPLNLNCHESDDPWPLLAGVLNSGTLSVFRSAGVAGGASTIVPQIKAFFAPTRNFFTGVLTPGVGNFSNVAKFYSAAPLPREKYTLWLFAATDGQTHMIDGVSDQAVKLGWGSDLTSVRTPCGAGWQILASSASLSTSSDQEDSVRAYEFPDRDPIAVSTPVSFPGPVTALWTESRGDTAIAVARNRETGKYEAFRLAMVCGQ
jgi:hypothetical protein